MLERIVKSKASILVRLLGAAVMWPAPALVAQGLEVGDDFKVSAGESLRELATRIEKRFGRGNLKRFEIGLGMGLDIRNGKAAIELIERDVQVGHPEPRPSGTVKNAIAEFPIRAALTFRAKGGAVRHLPFVLHGAYRVEEVRSAGLVLGRERLGSVLCVTLPVPLADGATTRLELRYRARVDRTREPRTFDERGFYGRSSFFWARSSLAWYPSLRGQGARGSLKVFIDRGWRAMGPGRMVADVPLAEPGFVEFVLDQPGDLYFVAGDLRKLSYAAAGHRRFEWIGPRECEGLGWRLMRVAAGALEWIEAQGLPVPPRNARAMQIATLPPPWKGTECWELLWTSPSFAPEPDGVAALMGRTWWWSQGRLRTSLDEALWVYLGRRYAIEKGWRNDRGDWWTCGESGRFCRAMVRSAGELGSLRSALRGEGADALLRALVVAGKGALFFRALEDAIGREKLLEVVRAVGALHGSRVSAKYWLQELAKQSAHDLGPLFGLWMDSAQIPYYEILSARAQRVDQRWMLAVEIRASNHPVGLALALEVTTAGGSERHALRPKASRESFLLPCGAKPLRVELDPDLRLLRDPRTLRLPLNSDELTGFMTRAASLTVVYAEHGRAPQIEERRKAAERLLARLRQVAQQADPAQVISDREALEGGLPSKGAVFLLGTREENSATRGLGARVPVARERGAVQIGERRFADLLSPQILCYWLSGDGQRLTVVWTAALEDLPRPDHQWIIAEGGVRVFQGFLEPRNRLVATVK